MSTNLSFRERLEQPAPAPAADLFRSGSPAHAILTRVLPLDQPVTLAKTLVGLGLSLRQAHMMLNRLAADEAVIVILPTVSDRTLTTEDLRRLGVAVEWRRAPDKLDVKAVRERLGLTQAVLPPVSAWNWIRCAIGSRGATPPTPWPAPC